MNHGTRPIDTTRPAGGGIGAVVYRGMDQATVDRQYNARASVPSFEDEHALYVRDSERVRQDLAGFETVVYDEASGERLDLYHAGPGSPLFLWIHGGYWRGGSRQDNAFAAGGLVRRGISVAVIDYSLAPGVRLPEIIRQVRSAVRWLVCNGPPRRLDVDRLHVGGSSAGGHLVGMLLADDGWTDAFGLRRDVIDVALALSGLFELDPLPLTQVNEWMQFTPEVIASCSPQRLIPRGAGIDGAGGDAGAGGRGAGARASTARLIASVGGQETAEFQRQTADYARAWRAAGLPVEVIGMPGFGHFNLARSLVEPDGVLVEAVARAIGSGRPEKRVDNPADEGGRGNDRGRGDEGDRRHRGDRQLR